MIELTYEQAPALAPLFSDTEETIIKSFVQGCMGRGWADKYPEPSCGMIGAGDFWSVAGDHTCEEARQLLKEAPIPKSAFCIPANAEWGALIVEMFGDRAKRFTRYAIKKESDVFDQNRLEALIAAMPENYSLRRIDDELYERCLELPFARDYCSNFSSAKDFAARGLGFCVMLGDEIVGGASSYTVYREGIEIEISIREDHRRKGLATAVAAKLILACLERGLYPSWDAANPWSVSLAEKLGYHFDYEYDAYAID